MKWQHNVCETIPGTMNTEPLGNWESRLSKLVDDIGRIFEFLSPEVLASFSSLACSVVGRDTEFCY